MKTTELIAIARKCGDRTTNCERECPMYGKGESCTTRLLNALSTKLEEQQAEIERCHKEFEELNIIEEEERKEALERARKESALFKGMVDYAIAEAIKEFAKRVKATFPPREDPRCTLDDCYTLDCIDNIAAEMTGGNDGY